MINSCDILRNLKYPKETVKAYLKLLFKDLETRSGKKEVDRAVFQEFFQIPMLLVERLFHVFNPYGNRKVLTMKEFVVGMITLFTGKFKNRAKLIFECFDFDSDGIITTGDIKFLFVHLHLAQSYSRAELLPLIVEITEVAFNSINKTTLDFQSFCELSENMNSDIVNSFLFFLWNFLPFKENQISYFHDQKKIKNEIKRKIPNNIAELRNFYINPSQKLCNYVCQLTFQPKKYTEDEDLENDLVQLNLFEEDLKKEISEAKKEILDSKSIKLDLRCSNIGASNPTNESQSTNLSRNVEEKSFAENAICLYNYKAGKKQKCKLVLFDDLLFYHKINSEAGIYTIHKLFSLKSTFVSKCEKVIINKHAYFSFQLKSNYAFCETFLGEEEEEITQFTKLIKEATKFRKIDDFYTFGKELGSGQFGKVNLAVNKATMEKVAVKIIPKKKDDNFLIRWEYDVFKFLQNTVHPSSIVKAIDSFETVSHFYFVYEYIPGCELKTYLKQQHTPLAPMEIKSLAVQLIDALIFLHQYGIIHRDLKLTNILVNRNEEGRLMLKIIDFGFSKIMAERDSTCEPYGSLIYTAPEIILDTPYNHKVDVWSLGVILYFILYGIHPFSSEGNNQSLKKAIAFNDVMFPSSFYYFPHQDDSNLLAIVEITHACLEKTTSKRPQISDLKYIVNNL